MPHTVVCQPDINPGVWLVVEGWRQLPYQDILTLQVSVDYVLAVQVLQGLRYLREEQGFSGAGKLIDTERISVILISSLYISTFIVVSYHLGEFLTFIIKYM